MPVRPLGAFWLPLWPSLGTCGIPLSRLGLPCGRLLDVVENWMSFSKQMLRFLDTVVQNQASPDSPGVPTVPGKVVSGTAAPTPCPHAPGARITVV